MCSLPHIRFPHPLPPKMPPPRPHPAFLAKKVKILGQLNVPDTEYSDASPKGSVDAGIRDLIDEINVQDGLVTTSSCAGRVSVFVEGRKASATEAEDTGGRGREKAASAVGGKGGGGAWLYVSHDPVPEDGLDNNEKLLGLLGLSGSDDEPASGQRLIHFKFEPMILHVLTTSHQHAQMVLKCALQAGFRESGTVSLLDTTTKSGEVVEAATPIVAIRSMGLSFESLIGMVDPTGRRKAIVSTDYLRMLVKIGNERFVENEKRISRFLDALRSGLKKQGAAQGEGNGKREKELRRGRKMAEGLRRQAEARRLKEQEIVEDLAERLENDILI